MDYINLVTVIVLMLICNSINADNFDDDFAVSLEERVSALETQVMVQSLKNRQAISTTEKKLLQMLEGRGSVNDNKESDPKVIERIDKLERKVNKVLKLVAASVKGRADEKAINRQSLDYLIKRTGSFRNEIEERMDNLEGMFDMELSSNKLDNNRPLISMIEHLNKTINELKNRAIPPPDIGLGHMTKPRVTDCPENWIKIENTCFLLVDDEKADWFSASIKCHEMDATLAEIKDDATFDRLVQNVTTYTWVGGTDEEVEGKWMWIGSNTEITYFNWAKNQPYSLADDQDCLEIWPFHRGFNDEACSVGGNYLCQKDLDRF